MYLNLFILPLHDVRCGFAGARPEKADDAVVAVFQLARVCRHAGAFEVARGRVDAQAQVADVAGYQRLVGDFPTTHDAVHVLPDQVHPPIADAHVQLDVRILRIEGRQCRNQDHPRQWAGDVHAQASSRYCSGGGQTGFGVVQIRQ